MAAQQEPDDGTWAVIAELNQRMSELASRLRELEDRIYADHRHDPVAGSDALSLSAP